jgi:hypothetical protein
MKSVQAVFPAKLAKDDICDRHFLDSIALVSMSLALMPRSSFSPKIGPGGERRTF